MDTTHVKYVNQLINAHKISMIIVPLIEAVEINKRTQGVEALELKSLLKQVIETGGELYQGLLDESEQLVDTGLVPDKLFLTLSKSLRNSIVLYNSSSLSLVKDSIADLFEDNIEFIQRYQNESSDPVNVNGRNDAALESARRKERQESIGYVSGALSEMFMPIWLFHTNLYTSGLIDESSMVELNQKTSKYLVDIMDTMLERLKSSQGKMSKDFELNSVFLCAEMIANVLHNYNGKLIKNRDSLNAYMKDPEKTLSAIVPALYANFTLLNEVAGGALSSMFSEQ